MDMGEAGANTSPRTENSLSLQVHQPPRISGNANGDRIHHTRRHRRSTALPLHTFLRKLPPVTRERNLCPDFNLQPSLQQRTIHKQQRGVGIDHQEHPLPRFQLDGTPSGNAHVLPVFWRTIQAPIRDPLGDRNHSRRRHSYRSLHRLRPNLQHSRTTSHKHWTDPYLLQPGNRGRPRPNNIRVQLQRPRNSILRLPRLHHTNNHAGNNGSSPSKKPCPRHTRGLSHNGNHFDHGRTIPRRCWSEIRSERADPDHVSRMVLYESLRVHQG